MMFALTVDSAKQFARDRFQKTAIVLAATSALAWLPNLAPVAAQSKPNLPKIPIVREELTPQELTVYERAEADLPEDYYILYRIVELMARVNDLDDLPWRVAISTVDEESGDCINAFASQANLIYFCKGMLDRLAGDVSAVACVVGHEMAHHQLQHIPTGVAAWDKGFEEIEKIEDEEDRQERIEAFIEQMEELSRTQELEADAMGYQYATAAGFEPEGCLRVMRVLSRLPGSLIERSHPTAPARIEAIQGLIEASSSATIEVTTIDRTDNLEPLTYSWLEEEKLLRVDSDRGGSFVEDWENRFGQNSEEGEDPVVETVSTSQ
ncbi:MAG TPA: M48 family metallopeptidase [Oscillatoriales cyanobacterium M59_W2019_021]|nr:M48 family metallopeptidase [Oscillatoriales cyanobacterium M59_W2019_021]